MRSSGVLINISSLPGEYGIGDFGDNAVKFAEWLKGTGFTKWQVLPLTCIGLGNSPYSGASAFAGNYLYINIDGLREDGFLTEEEAGQAKYTGSPHTVDYGEVMRLKGKAIRLAYSRAGENSAVSEYYDKNKYWLDDYALYMAIKETEDGKAWYDWDNKYKFREKSAIEEFKKANSARLGYYIFEQYLFDRDWKACKRRINETGVEIIGDMPIYVSMDSADVWANPDLFQLDEDLNPTFVAGVPPDYFSATGQLWGNPLYDWAIMKENDYDWFVKRAGRMRELYDCTRFDHFRAFDRYWAVKHGSPDAICGEWVRGGGKALFDAIYRKYPDMQIIAEDLGIIDDGVAELRDSIGLAGMRVLHFAFDGYDSTNMPHNYISNTVAYTGTHDNNTTFGWLYEITPEHRAAVYDYVGASGGVDGGADSPQVFACIRAVMTSVADTAIIPFQDLCGWGGDTRMNIPGVAEANWRIRITESDIRTVKRDKFLRLNKLSARI